MFRWCSYCQSLIGESPPLDTYRVTHGICPSCRDGLESYTVEPEHLRAGQLLSTLEAAGRSGEFSTCVRAIDEAIGSGMRPSEVMVGVLHPALGRVGDLWESGEITVADEHRFTAFALDLVEHLRVPDPPRTGPLVLLAPFGESCHEVGMRMLQHLAWERGIACERLPVGASETDLMAAIARRPAMVGLSVSLVEMLPDVVPFARRLRAQLPKETKLLLGGQAFRRGSVQTVPDDLDVVLTVDGYVERLERLKPHGTARSGRGSSRA